MNIEIIVVICIAVAGWIFTHWLTIRAQNKAFVNQVINQARLEITGAIRDYQDWLVRVYAGIKSLDLDITLRERGFPNPWEEMVSKLGDLFFLDRRASAWAFRLEEYEILFPETQQCRVALLSRQVELHDHLSSFMKQVRPISLEPVGKEQAKETIDDAVGKVHIALEQGSLMEDLRIYLQNRCLSSFTGNKIPERQIENSSAPRLVQDETGNLQIVTPQSLGKGDDD